MKTLFESHTKTGL